MKEYIDFIIKPYLSKMRNSLNLVDIPKGDRCLLIVDHHWSHLTEETKSHLNDMNVDLEFIPKKCTDYFSVLDVSINKPFKTKLKTLYNNHISRKISNKLNTGVVNKNILKLNQ